VNEHVPELELPAVSVIEAGHERVSRPKPAGPLTIFDRFTGPANPPIVVGGRLETVTITCADPPEEKLTFVLLVARLTPVTWMLRTPEITTPRPDGVSFAL
jgi:hypothetical protein